MTNKELEQKLNQLTDLVIKLAEKLPEKLEKSENSVQAPANAVSATSGLSIEKRIQRLLGGESDPVPLDYKTAVSEILNGNFNIHVKAATDMPSFKFTIIVPQKYSQNKDYEINSDLRPRVISYAEGLMGVKSWCERVMESFNSEVKIRIISERTPASLLAK